MANVSPRMDSAAGDRSLPGPELCDGVPESRGLYPKRGFLFISFYVDTLTGKATTTCTADMWHCTKQARRELPC